MDHVFQRTLKKRISCTGVGLHSGVAVSMTLHPAAPNTGIVFQRTDVVPGAGHIPARWNHIHSGVLCTTLANEQGVTIGTVEHLMAALAGCGIDNALVRLDGPEVPVMDGSAAPFVLLVECAGIVVQEAPRWYLRVLKRIDVADGGKAMSLQPADEFRVRFEIDFDSPAVAHQSCVVHITERSFKEDVGSARTFGFVEDVQGLRENGFGCGGTLDNVVMVDGDSVLNEGGLRFNDEFVRHKVLDCVGDMYLAGGPMLAEVAGVRSGHTLSHRLLNALFADETAWRYETFAAAGRDDAHQAPVRISAPVAATA